MATNERWIFLDKGLTGLYTHILYPSHGYIEPRVTRVSDLKSQMRISNKTPKQRKKTIRSQNEDYFITLYKYMKINLYDVHR